MRLRSTEVSRGILTGSLRLFAALERPTTCLDSSQQPATARNSPQQPMEAILRFFADFGKVQDLPSGSKSSAKVFRNQIQILKLKVESRELRVKIQELPQEVASRESGTAKGAQKFRSSRSLRRARCPTSCCLGPSEGLCSRPADCVRSSTGRLRRRRPPGEIKNNQECSK